MIAGNRGQTTVSEQLSEVTAGSQGMETVVCPLFP
jgi:hypothetical protein